MPDPARSAGGTPDDWGTAKKGGCGKVFAIMLLAGAVSVAQLTGVLHLIGRVLS